MLVDVARVLNTADLRTSRVGKRLAKELIRNPALAKKIPPSQ